MEPSIKAGVTLHVVPATLADLGDVMDIERGSFRVPWPRADFEAELERECAHLWVLKDAVATHRPAVAFCNFWRVLDEIHIHNVATHPQMRRRGHAARLLTSILDLAATENCTLVTLEVRRSNAAAQGLYRRFGFRSIAIRRQYYADNGDDALVMHLELPVPP